MGRAYAIFALSLASCSWYNAPQNGVGSNSARNPWSWSVDYSNNGQDLAVLVGDQVEIILGSVGGGWQYDEPEISSSAIQMQSRTLQQPPNPGGPVYIYTLKAAAEGEARFRLHFSNRTLSRDEAFALTVRVAAIHRNSSAPSNSLETGHISTFDSTEPVLGTWVLNLPKSTFDPSHALRSEIRTFKPAPEGIKQRVDAVKGDISYSGPSSLYERTGIVTTAPQVDKITRVGSREYRIEQLDSGKPVGSQTAIVSKDGMRLTITTARAFAFLKAPHDVRVFDRQ